MIGQRYREKKTAVLDVVARYQSIRGANEDGVDPAFLDQRAEALKEGRYVLAVVGETKAGKSTLINALLGERILPTDIFQSSSAVIEIFKSEEKYVSVTYADGHTEKVRDDLDTPDIDEAVEHLRKIGSIQDRFRTIPTTTIDAYIVQGKITPGGSLLTELQKADSSLLKELEKASGLRLAGEKDLIAEYVRGRTLADIPVEIKFGFPLRYAFNELRLVDSPGVNASGGVQDHTYKYLHTANAVLFVHSLEEAVEKSSLRDFIVRVVPNRTRQALFLRALCTLATCEPTYAKSCVRDALAILKAKLMTHDRRVDSGVMRRYLADRIVSCLALGVFNVDGKAIRGISTVVNGVVTGELDAFSELRQRLSSGWGARDSRIGAVKRIRELVLDRALRAKAKRDSSAAIEQITSTYFLGNNPVVVKEIVDQVTARLGGEQWTQ